MHHFGWEWIFIKTASLDNPGDFPPSTHFGTESQIPWHEIRDELPRIRCEESPELSELWESAGVRVTDPPRATAIASKQRAR